jgi:hypothetical protein
MFPPLGILIGQLQLERAAVWILMTQCLDSTGQNTADYIVVCSRTVTLRIPAIAWDIIV